MYDTIIIGAGMSGLAAGIRLAYFDQRVCILERHTTIGGLNSFYRLGGRNYDVGLHAVTNFTPQGHAQGPAGPAAAAIAAHLGRFLPVAADRLDDRVSRRHAAIQQRLRVLSIRGRIGTFPRENDNFQQACRARSSTTTSSNEQAASRSARQIVGQIITDPLLVEMLFCPLMFYGSAREHDMDFGQFSIMFRSIFLEGFARPLAGVRLILKNLVRRFKQLGGELRLRAGVERIAVEQGRVAQRRARRRHRARRRPRALVGRLGRDDAAVRRRAAASDDRRPGSCRSSSRSRCSMPAARAGLRPHDRVLQRQRQVPLAEARRAGRRAQRRDLLARTTFDYDRAAGRGHDARSRRWPTTTAGEPAGRATIRRPSATGTSGWSTSAVRFVPDFRPRVVATDMFTPDDDPPLHRPRQRRGLRRARKALDGTTHLKNLFICGTDQGFVGIVGTMISGITMANRHLLRHATGAIRTRPRKPQT